MSKVKLFRPVGQKEYELIKGSGMSKFPPRLEWQPIFYPVLNLDYAAQIAAEWNTKDEFSGYVGYVLSFDIPADYFQKFNIENVGAKNHNELWVPAEELEEFNGQLLDRIKVEKVYYGKQFIGTREY